VGSCLPQPAATRARVATSTGGADFFQGRHCVSIDPSPPASGGEVLSVSEEGRFLLGFPNIDLHSTSSAALATSPLRAIARWFSSGRDRPGGNEDEVKGRRCLGGSRHSGPRPGSRPSRGGYAGAWMALDGNVSRSAGFPGSLSEMFRRWETAWSHCVPQTDEKSASGRRPRNPSSVSSSRFPCRSPSTCGQSKASRTPSSVRFWTVPRQREPLTPPTDPAPRALTAAAFGCLFAAQRPGWLPQPTTPWPATSTAPWPSSPHVPKPRRPVVGGYLPRGASLDELGRCPTSPKRTGKSHESRLDTHGSFKNVIRHRTRSVGIAMLCADAAT
jgi:hypothetical protein